VDDLKRELAAKKAYIAKLEQRLRDLTDRKNDRKWAWDRTYYDSH
jgi:hypothetical protein